MLGMSTMAQLRLLVSEVLSLLGSDSIMAHYNAQNTVDTIAIFYTFFYNVCRAIMPCQTWLTLDRLENATMLEDGMPILHFVMLVFIFFQALFYLRLNDERAKFIQLFYKSFRDAGMFLYILALLVAWMGFTAHVLGASFDDGTNYSPEYDGDYPFIYYVSVCIAAALRNTMGDLNTPVYQYWIVRY